MTLDHPARAVRELAGLSQSEAAEAIGHTRSAVARAEARGDGITVRALRELCDALGLELEIRATKRSRPRETQGRNGSRSGRDTPPRSAAMGPRLSARKGP